MKKTMVRILLITLGISMSQSLWAGVIRGSINYESNGLYTNLDSWKFRQNTDGNASFDVLAYGFSQAFLTGVSTDPQNVISYLDSMIWLFEDDGDLGLDDLIVKNDDSLLGADGNHSLIDPANPSQNSSLDPYLSLFLPAGDYRLLVGSCCGNQLNLASLNQFIDPNQIFHPADGYYRLDFSGDITLTHVNEPNSIALFGMVFLCLSSRKIKKAIISRGAKGVAHGE